MPAQVHWCDTSFPSCDDPGMNLRSLIWSLEKRILDPVALRPGHLLLFGIFTSPSFQDPQLV